MVAILYAITKDNYFCKKETLDKKVDDLSWMRIPTDRKFFKELTTLHNNQPILVGYKTARVMPKLDNREIITISTNSERGIWLNQAMQKYPNGILIGGASVLKSALQLAHRNYINSVLTIRLPIRVPIDEAKDYLLDPLLQFKESGLLKLSSSFYIYTENFEQPTIFAEFWRPTYA